MARISNQLKNTIMNRLYQGKGIADIAQKYGLSDKIIANCIDELNAITQGERCGTMAKSFGDSEINRSVFNNYCWQIISKANEILISKLESMSAREKEIDRLLVKIEEQLDEDCYDKTQMGKLIKLLDSIKSNNISELARVIQILYDRTSDKNKESEDKSLEDFIYDLSGESF